MIKKEGRRNERNEKKNDKKLRGILGFGSLSVCLFDTIYIEIGSRNFMCFHQTCSFSIMPFFDRHNRL